MFTLHHNLTFMLIAIFTIRQPHHRPGQHDNIEQTEEVPPQLDNRIKPLQEIKVWLFVFSC